MTQNGIRGSSGIPFFGEVQLRVHLKRNINEPTREKVIVKKHKISVKNESIEPKSNMLTRENL